MASTGRDRMSSSGAMMRRPSGTPGFKSFLASFPFIASRDIRLEQSYLTFPGVFYTAGFETVSIPVFRLSSHNLISTFISDGFHNAIVYLRNDSISISTEEGSGRDRQGCGLEPLANPRRPGSFATFPCGDLGDSQMEPGSPLW